MQFDVFHSIGRIDSIKPRLTDKQVMTHFIDQAKRAEDFDFNTIWVAESHFSSEVQKSHRSPVIPHYAGEVGINADSVQLANFLFEQTKRINFGTAIHNIVGGNGGPIASADRMRTLAFLNGLRARPRRLHIGIASGRFPYINAPFGIHPRNPEEQALWPQVQRCIFMEALEIFLRLSLGETIASEDITPQIIDQQEGWLAYSPRWHFEALRLVPDIDAAARSLVQYVLGSHDPKARDLAFRLYDVDIFNLSFTPPDAIDKVHREMQAKCQAPRRPWSRERMPRTVLVFIDKDVKVARARASACFETYIEAMRGTVGTPPKETLMERALVGDPMMLREQLTPGEAHGFHPDDRLMLWFEFNQSDHAAIVAQMRLFAEEVMPHFVK